MAHLYSSRQPGYGSNQSPRSRDSSPLQPLSENRANILNEGSRVPPGYPSKSMSAKEYHFANSPFSHSYPEEKVDTYDYRRYDYYNNSGRHQRWEEHHSYGCGPQRKVPVPLPRHTRPLSPANFPTPHYGYDHCWENNISSSPDAGRVPDRYQGYDGFENSENQGTRSGHFSSEQPRAPSSPTLVSPLPPSHLKEKESPPHDATASVVEETRPPGELRSVDIVCGRGAPTNYHIGNQSFKELVEEYQTSYLCAKRSAKPQIALKILDLMKAKGARFVKRQKTAGHFAWVEINDKGAYEKVCQALRDGAPDLRRQMLSSEKMKKGV